MAAFLPYIRKELKLYLLGFAGSLFRFLIPLALPLIIKYIFDQLLQNGALSASERYARLTLIALVVAAVFFLVRAPMEFVRQYFLHKANNNVIKALRRDTFAKVHALDAKYLADHKSGEIGTRFFDDIEKIRGYLTAALSNIWIETVVLLFVVGAMAFMNVKLTALAVLLVGFQFFLAYLLSKRFKASTADMMRYRSVLSGFVFEKIQGAFIAKLFASEDRDRQELDRHLKAYEKLTDRQAKLNAITLSSVNVLSDITPFLVVLAGSVLVIGGHLTLGSLLAFYAYVDKMRSPVAALVQAFPAVTEGSVALQRIFDFLRTPSEIKEKEQPAELRSFGESIRFRNVSFGYAGRDSVLKNLSLKLEKGKTYAFVGESGGGKSTLLQLLFRMYDPKEGAVFIDGVDIREYSLSSLRGQMGVVTQDNFLYSCSIKDNLKLAKPDATDEEIAAAAKKAYAHDFIAALPQGYDTEIGERGVKLSGGQKQRLALARVFLKDPSILILDEATSALDNESEKLVQESIQGIGRDKTVLLIAHRLSTVVHADTIFVMKHGEIVEQGSHGELLRLGGYYRDLYRKQETGTERKEALLA
ncbi:ABC transporter ATP-binding protein [Cohnella caldifontis]|uniref:ABC transporter ATP-binding protein n=1 Tax=Cohnella caldifontis TaxID=3027471 RepID=UPI0023ECFA74|nr:ABC transporter ATP-binding protein [Cohnella sp. YIM B05605]